MLGVINLTPVNRIDLVMEIRYFHSFFCLKDFDIFTYKEMSRSVIWLFQHGHGNKVMICRALFISVSELKFFNTNSSRTEIYFVNNGHKFYEATQVSAEAEVR